MSDQTEQRIKDLCTQAIRAKDNAEVERILTDFRAALEEHTRQAKIALAATASLWQPNDADLKPMESFPGTPPQTQIPTRD